MNYFIVFYTGKTVANQTFNADVVLETNGMFLNRDGAMTALLSSNKLFKTVIITGITQITKEQKGEWERKNIKSQ